MASTTPREGHRNQGEFYFRQFQKKNKAREASRKAEEAVLKVDDVQRQQTVRHLVDIILKAQTDAQLVERLLWCNLPTTSLAWSNTFVPVEGAVKGFRVYLTKAKRNLLCKRLAVPKTGHEQRFSRNVFLIESLNLPLGKTVLEYRTMHVPLATDSANYNTGNPPEPGMGDELSRPKPPRSLFSTRPITPAEWKSSLSFPEALRQLASDFEVELEATVVGDSIEECGTAPLEIIRDRPDEVIRLAHRKLHTWPYSEVPTCWRRLYEEGSIRKAINMIKAQAEIQATDFKGRKRYRDGTTKIESTDASYSAQPDTPNQLCREDGEDDWIANVVRVLDMGLILTGAPGRSQLITDLLDSLQLFLVPTEESSNNSQKDKAKVYDSGLPHSFPVPPPLPTFQPVSSNREDFVRLDRLDFTEFQSHLDTHATPIIIKDALTSWPAISDPSHRWADPTYLLNSTLGGRRLVPVELGRSYTSSDWGQKILTFAEYMHTYLLDPQPETVGYLAQHDLFAQIPSLRADTVTPDYCYTEPPRSAQQQAGAVATATLEEPLRNAWLGPRGTISPLHTDPYHNILCQVVGCKYVRLYAPEQTKNLYPRGTDAAGVNMENTSFVDVEVARRVFGETDNETGAEEEVGGHSNTAGTERNGIEEQRAQFEAAFPRFRGARYVDGILGPGECLYIPTGWWHYVESLSTSFSMSFWWN